MVSLSTLFGYNSRDIRELFGMCPSSSIDAKISILGKPILNGSRYVALAFFSKLNGKCFGQMGNIGNFSNNNFLKN
jgi:hypothetical protein